MRDAYEALYDAQNEVACLMFGSMSPDLQRTLENYKAYDMIQELKTMFEEQAKHELFETVKAFHACKQEDGQSVRSYLLKMKSYLDTLERLGYGMPNELGIPKKAETPAVLAIWEGRIQKDKKKPQGAKAKDSICHHCKEVGHWRRNCPSYHAKLKKRKNASVASTSSIFTIELYAFPNKTWVYDMSCGIHICNTSQGLRESRKLKHGALSLYMGNGMRATVKAIGSFDLILPSGLIIVLDNCHFAPTVTRGVVSISRLVNNGYIHTFMKYGISVSKDNVFYFNAIPRDGIYGIDMHNLYPNVNSMYNVSNKRAKRALDSSYLWHCRLGHINKKRIDKLQRDRILQPTHDESLEKCKSCISGKMARKPFPHQVERAKDLLGHIHTYVCGPFRTVSREGVSERRNQTLLDMVQSMMNLTTLLKSFWGYALESAARILNMVPTKKSAKQSTTAMSSTEAEYIAAAKASMKAVWMRKFIDGLGNVVPSNKRPMEMKYHYIREVIQEPEIVLKKVHTVDNVADLFTKPMPFNKHYEHAMGIGIVHASSLM
ncbi:zinc finger, CCHC-type containing protein [Tanacetum coccineum]